MQSAVIGLLEINVKNATINRDVATLGKMSLYTSFKTGYKYDRTGIQRGCGAYPKFTHVSLFAQF